MHLIRDKCEPVNYRIFSIGIFFLQVCFKCKQVMCVIFTVSPCILIKYVFEFAQVWVDQEKV